MSDLDELLVIDGVDESTASELQMRAADIAGCGCQSCDGSRPAELGAKTALVNSTEGLTTRCQMIEGTG